MKKAYHYTSWRFNDEKVFCGVNFGYDFCAEHEIGIAGIREAFGIKRYSSSIFNGIKKMFGTLQPILGIEARVIKEIPQTLQFKQKGDFCCIYYSSSIINESVFEHGIKTLAWESSKPGGQDLSCFWGDDSFMIVTTNMNYFNQLKKGFLEKKVAIFTAGRNGLVLCLTDMLDEKTKADMMSSDYNAWELRKAADESGIEKALIKAKKEFFALSPAWKDKHKKEVWFWLNPRDQRSYEAGWYTIDELKDWTENKGPVIKKDKGDTGKKYEF